MAGRNDSSGWKRGAGHYSRDYVKFDRPEDRKAVKSLDGAVNAGRGWSGPVSKGGPPRYKPKHGPLTNGAN